MSIKTQLDRIKTGKESIATAIENKGVNVPADALIDDFASYISQIKSDPVLQEKSVTPTTSAQSVTPDSGYDGLSKVNVGAIQIQEKWVTPDKTTQNIYPDSGKYLGKVKIDPIPDTYVEPTATKTATTYTPTKLDQTIAAGTYCSGAQTIKGDSNLSAGNIAKGVSIFGVTGTLISGAKYVTGTVTTNNANPYEEDKIIRLYDIGINPRKVIFYVPDMAPSTSRQYFVIAIIADTDTNECIAIRRDKGNNYISSYIGAAYCEADGKITNIFCSETLDEEKHCYASSYNYIAIV